MRTDLLHNVLMAAQTCILSHMIYFIAYDHPSQHKILIQCYINVGPPYLALTQHESKTSSLFVAKDTAVLIVGHYTHQ